MDELCFCGDEYDDHDHGGGRCTVPGCGCAGFDPDEDDD